MALEIPGKSCISAIRPFCNCQACQITWQEKKESPRLPGNLEINCKSLVKGVATAETTDPDGKKKTGLGNLRLVGIL